MKRWEYRQFTPAEADRIQSEHSISRLLAVLLVQRGIADPEQAGRFLQPSLSHLHTIPTSCWGWRKAVERLQRAIANQERILIYGDYDVDGTTSVVILRKAIELAGGEADFHVPHRVKEGLRHAGGRRRASLTRSGAAAHQRRHRYPRERGRRQGK